MSGVLRDFKNQFINYGLFVISFLFFLMVTEVILRSSFIPVQPIFNQSERIEFEKDGLSYRMEPAQKLVLFDGHIKTEVIIDHNGYRDLDVPSFPDKGLIAVGDSYTFGHGVASEDTWVEQLQETLRVKVLNTGVQGYSLSDYQRVLSNLRQRGVLVRVILYAMPWNDIHTGASVDARKSGLKVAQIFTVAQDRWAIMALAYRAVSNLAALFKIQVNLSEDRGLQKEIDLAKKQILEMAATARQLDVQLVIVYIGDITFVMDDLWNAHSRRHSYSRTIIQDNFSGWSHKNNILFGDAVGALQRAYRQSNGKRDSIALKIDNHYNRNGYQIIAESFNDILKDNKLFNESSKLTYKN